MGIGALFEHENHRGTGLKLIADRFLLLIVRKMLDVTGASCRRHAQCGDTEGNLELLAGLQDHHHKQRHN